MKNKLRRIVAAFILIVSLVLATTTVVSATGGPHEGTFTPTTDACAGCHRTHTGTAAYILRSTSQYSLCTTCHGGTGADTDVVNGIYLGTANGTQNAGLRGGGFVNAIIDTDRDGSASSTSITSKHTVGATQAKAWGSGNISTSAYAGEGMTLECGSCHNPHGNSQYRILRPMPTGLVTDAPTANVTVPYVTAENYTMTYDSDNFTDTTVYASGIRSVMADWCGQCHKRYIAGSTGATTNSTDAVFMYRHPTDADATLTQYGECLACHVAHGTSASMSGNSANSTLVIWPNSENATWQDTDENDYSRLLRVDSRGICLRCHTSSELTQN